MSSYSIIAAIIFVVTAMFSMGLNIRAREVLEHIRNKSLMGRVLLANLVIVPILGWIIVRIIHMPTYVAVGFLLMAASPGAPYAMRFTSGVREGLPFAAAMVLVLMASSIIFTPLIARLVLPVNTAARMPYLLIALEFLFYLLLPLAVGIFLHVKAEPVANKLAKPASILSTVSFIVWIILTYSVRRQAREALSGSSLFAIFVLIVLSIAVGWYMGGPDRATRRILAVSTSMRNVTVCTLIAVQSFPDTSVGATVTAFLAIMIPVNFLFSFYENRRMRREITHHEHRRAA